jgi:hypothetical protein
MYIQQIAAAMQYSRRHHSAVNVRLTGLALRFSLGCRLLADTARFYLTRDRTRRQRLQDNISLLRSMVRGPWRAVPR